MKRIGLYFGSFNPIHRGHIQLANDVIENNIFDEVWLLPSPHNPFKNQSDLIPANLRLEWVQKAISNEKKLKCCDIEFSLPLPNYTYNTVQALKQKHPDFTFELIIGADNMLHFHQWKNAENLAQECPLNVYPRKNCNLDALPNTFNAKVLNTPLYEISATEVREAWLHYSTENENWLRLWTPKPIFESVRSFFQSIKSDFN